MDNIKSLIEKIVRRATVQIDDNIKEGSVEEKDRSYEIKTLAIEELSDYTNDILEALEGDIENMVASQN